MRCSNVQMKKCSIQTTVQKETSYIYEQRWRNKRCTEIGREIKVVEIFCFKKMNYVKFITMFSKQRKKNNNNESTCQDQMFLNGLTRQT